MYVFFDQNNTDYGEGNENSTTVKFETKVIRSRLCDYSDTYIIVTGEIKATGGDANTRVTFKNCASFTKCITHINDEHVKKVKNSCVTKILEQFLEIFKNAID